jgi:branched-subunit amino acid transport protein
MSTAMTVILGCALVTFAIKAAGPIALGGRELPERFTGVINLLGPALLSALVVTQALANGDRWAIDEATAGVAAAGIVAWRGGSVVLCLVVAAAVTAGLRAI